MTISVKGTKVKENAALEEYALKKAQKFNQIFTRIDKVDIVLNSIPARSGVKDDFEVTLHVHIPGKTETVKELTGDMYAGIDLATERMVEILRRQKSKGMSKKRHAIKLWRDRIFTLIRRRSQTND